VVEGTPLESMNTLIAYRGFEFLPFHQHNSQSIKKREMATGNQPHLNSYPGMYPGASISVGWDVGFPERWSESEVCNGAEQAATERTSRTLCTLIYLNHGKFWRPAPAPL
jgi:hypothetical protein